MESINFARLLNVLKSGIRVFEHLRRRGYKVRIFTGESLEVKQKFFNVEVRVPRIINVDSLIDIYLFLGKLIFNLYKIIFRYKRDEDVYRNIEKCGSKIEVEAVKLHLTMAIDLDLLVSQVEPYILEVIPKDTYKRLYLSMEKYPDLIKNSKKVLDTIRLFRLISCLKEIKEEPTFYPSVVVKKIIDKISEIAPWVRDGIILTLRNAIYTILHFWCSGKKPKPVEAYINIILHLCFDAKLAKEQLEIFRSIICRAYPAFLKYKFIVEDHVRNILTELLDKSDKIKQEIAGIMIIDVDHEKEISRIIDFVPTTTIDPHSSRVGVRTFKTVIKKFEKIMRENPDKLVTFVHSHPGGISRPSYGDIEFTYLLNIWDIVLSQDNDFIYITIHFGHALLRTVKFPKKWDKSNTEN